MKIGASEILRFLKNWLTQFVQSFGCLAEIRFSLFCCFQILSNGGIGFEQTSRSYKASVLPGNVQLIAPFWNRNDLRNGGRVYYREERGLLQSLQDFLEKLWLFKFLRNFLKLFSVLCLYIFSFSWQSFGKRSKWSTVSVWPNNYSAKLFIDYLGKNAASWSCSFAWWCMFFL